MTQEQINEVVHKFGVPLSQVKRETNHAMWFKLYYHEQPTKGLDHVAKLAKDFPAEAALFRPLVEQVVAAHAARKVEVAAEKARKAVKRDAVAARKAEAGKLGVDLRKIDPQATEATYRLIRDTLVKAGFVSVLAATVFERLLDSAAKAGRSFVETQLRAQATQMAEDDVFGFAGKLAGKVDRDAAGVKVAAVAVAARGSLWTGSTLIATLVDGTTQRWHTQCILNVSCHGLLFNQWPTRRA